jgi:dolichol-phosphate mannosyltransferase
MNQPSVPPTPEPAAGRPMLSLIFPVFNEEAALPRLFPRLDRVVEGLVASESDIHGFHDVEAIFVDDGSRDASYELLTRYAADRPWMRVLSLSRNFGHQIAVTAGMEHARGRAVALLDADLQDPPELLPAMLQRWREGAEVVYAVRTERAGETWFKKATASLFYRLLRRLTAVDIPADTGDFRLMDRKVVDALNRMGEHHRFLRGMAAWVGFRQVGMPYQREARAAGETKYPLRKMGKLAMDAVCSFSHAPLRLATNLGWGIAAVAIAYAIVVAVRRLFFGVGVPGWASLVVALSFLSGVQLITLGLIGEYIGRIYDEVKGRPLYLVSRRAGFGDDERPERTG